MILGQCQYCGTYYIVNEHNDIEGCRDSETYDCPSCGREIGSVSTSGIPTVKKISKKRGRKNGKRNTENIYRIKFL